MSSDRPRRRSDCPISFSLDLLGDRWTLLVLRDLVFVNKHYFGDFLESPEGIASNILADRLRLLHASGLVSRRRDTASGRKIFYELTEKGIDLVPVLLELIRWGAKYDPRTAAAEAFTRRIAEERDGLISEIRASLL